MSDYWEENGIEKPQQVVVCPACKLDSVMVCGARHFDHVMRNQMNHMDQDLDWKKAEQGFIDQFGYFLTRKEAMQIVKGTNQPFNAGRNGGTAYLFSEGLY